MKEERHVECAAGGCEQKIRQGFIMPEESHPGQRRTTEQVVGEPNF